LASVFIIDDEKQLLELYRIGLELKGYKLAGEAENGLEAIKKLDKLEAEHKWPDVIIIDHRMPGLSGIETLRRLKARIDAYKTKVVFVTADPLIKEEAQKIGVSLFLQKPVSVLTVSSLLETIT